MFDDGDWFLSCPAINLEQLVEKYNISPQIIPAWDRDGISDLLINTSSYRQYSTHPLVSIKSTPFRFYHLPDTPIYESPTTASYLRLYAIYANQLGPIASWMRQAEYWKIR
jgi:hypothetical protein